MHHLIKTLAAGALVAASLLSAPAARATAASGPYIDAWSYFSSDADYEAWFTLIRNLRSNFDNICGDTFCEGDFSNIESLRYTCSVHQVSGRIGSCVWTFAGSNDDIDPATGRITITGKFWKCRTPLVRGTTIEQFLVALKGDEPLEAPLPNTTKTIYDGLVDCL